MGLKATNQILGGTFLVAGTCIGAGMLGLPVQTGPAGFIPTAILFLICWAVMLFTALCMLEATLYCPGETNLVSMMRRTLGAGWGKIAFIVYVAFFYSLMAAYVTGGSAIITDAIRRSLHAPISPAIGTTLYVGVFAAVVAYGASWVDWLNRFLMIGLVVAYLLLIDCITPFVNLDYLEGGDAFHLVPALPLIVTTFGFHLLIPSLKGYLQGNPTILKTCIIFGSIFALSIYLLWILLILGIIPIEGVEGLRALGQQGDPNVRLMHILDERFQSLQLTLGIEFFTLFALLSSVVGVALSLFDFFADAFQISKNQKGKTKLAILTFGLPTLFAYSSPEGFLIALRYAGIFASILLILFPIMMVWAGRYRLNLQGDYQVGGGKLGLSIGALFGILVVVSMFVSV